MKNMRFPSEVGIVVIGRVGLVCLSAACGWAQDEAGSVFSLHLHQASIEEAWPTLREATGLRIVGPAPSNSGVLVSVSIDAVPQEALFDSVAEATGLRWHRVGEVIAFGPGPRPLPEPPPSHRDTVDDLVSFLEGLSPQHRADVANGRLLPLSMLSPEEAQWLQSSLSQMPQDITPMEGAEEGEVSIGVFFHPSITVYDSLDSDWGNEAVFLFQPRRRPLGAEEILPSWPPMLFAPDAEGRLAPLTHED